LTNSNVKAALRLYRWNIDLSGAVYEALHVVEVALRNAMDVQLCKWNAAQTNAGTGINHSGDWLMDPARLLTRLAGKDLAKATSWAHKALQSHQSAGRRAPGHPDLLCQLTFGTWRFLLPSNDPGRQLLWDQALNRAFPHLATPPAQLVTQIDGIYHLRNRVAHLEPLLRPGYIEREFRAMCTVLQAINPAVAAWFISQQRVTATLKMLPTLN